jgi:predicted transcriptional regulator
MEVQFSPEVQARLDQLASETGRAPEEFVQDAMAGYFDELLALRETLNRRYDEVASGKVEGISGEDVAEYFREKSAAWRSKRG